MKERFSRKHETGEAHQAARAAYRARMQAKRESAIQRQRAWARLTFQDQLRALDRRLGFGQGAKKQRARIWAAIHEANK